MGGHYGSIHIRTEDASAVVSAVHNIAANRKLRFLIALPITGWITVFPEGNGQDEKVSSALATRLQELELIHCAVHDDDIFAYWFYQHGLLKDRYNSCPDYFDKTNPEPRGGDAQALAHLLAKGKSVVELQAVLNASRLEFEVERLDQFAALLGLPNAVSAYEHLQTGERDGIKQWKRFIHVPALTDEKEEKRAAARQVRMEMKRLIASGVLLADLAGKRSSHPLFFKLPVWCINSTSNDLLYAWSNVISSEPASTTTLQRFDSSHLNHVATKIELPSAVRRMVFAKSGRWLVVPGAPTQIWDFSTEVTRLQTPHLQGARTICFSPDGQIIYGASEGRIEVFSLIDFQARDSIPFAGAVQSMAIHPDGRVLVLADNFGVLILIDLQSFGVMTQVWIKQKAGILPEVLLAKGVANAKATFESSLKGQISDSQLEKFRADSERHFLPKDPIRTVTFTTEGEFLLCGTSEGLHVLDWNEVVGSPEMSTVASRIFVKADAVRRDLGAGHSCEQTLVYAVVFDELRQRVLFSGLEGKVRFLELADGSFGDLLTPPDPVPLLELGLLPDRTALICTAQRIDVRKQHAPHLQIWSYPALCKAAGIPY